LDVTIITIIAGIISGIVLALPPGIINLTMVNLISTKKFNEAFYIGAGSATIDIFYALVAIYSTSHIYKLLIQFTTENPRLILVLELLLIIILLIYGLNKLFERKNEIQSINIQRYSKYLNKLHPFISGCFLATTHIVVPTFIPGYAYMSTLLLKSGFIGKTTPFFLLFSFFFGVGNLIWVSFLVIMSRKYEHFITDRNYIRVQRILGILFIAVSIIMLYKAVFFTEWDKILF
jgi:threonine/homoserine/homoserine lactone efflux protein